MINLFKIAYHDQSISYLAQIFGPMNGVLTPPGVHIATPTFNWVLNKFDFATIATATLEQNLVFGSMFRVFNSIVLAVAALIVLYVTIVGVMSTAHEGEFMGKKFNKLWMPLRMIMGIVFLVPTATGYSTLQLIMMWVIVQGIGAADTLWTSTLQTITAPAVVAQTTLPSAVSDNQLKTLFQAVTCDETASFSRKSPEISYYCYENDDDDFCSSSRPKNISRAPDNSNPDKRLTYAFGPGGSCGTLSYCNPSTQSGGGCAQPDSIQCKSCQVQGEVLEATISQFRAIASQLVVADYALQKYHDGSDSYFTNWMAAYCNSLNPAVNKENCTPDKLPDPRYEAQDPSSRAVADLYWPFFVKNSVGGSANFIQIAKDNYNYKFQTLYDAAKSEDGSVQIKLHGIFKEAEDLGWIFAGAFYYSVAQANNDNMRGNTQTFEITPPPTEDNEINVKNSDMEPLYRTNYKAADWLVKSMLGQAAASMPGSEASGAVSEAAGSFSEAMVRLSDPAAGTNPLIQLQSVGYWLLFSAQIAFVIFTAIAIVLGILSGLNVFVIGSGGINPMFAMTPILYMIFVPLMFGILGIMISVGALLGVYVPLIPYIVFSMGAIGWIMATIEAMVAGPLVALGILSPGGHHELLGKAEHALGILFNIFLRPSLMIFGLIAAMMMAGVVVTMINTAFGMVMLTIIGQGAQGGQSGTAGGFSAAYMNPLEAVFFLVAYVTLIVSSLNKCFAAIHIIPERVVTWIGMQGMSFGEGEALQESKGAVTGAASKAGHAASATGEGVGRGAKEGIEGGKAKKAENEANKPTLSAPAGPKKEDGSF